MIKGKLLAYHVHHRNPKNRLITIEDVYKIFRKFKINKTVNHIENYRQAFIHLTYVKPTHEQLNKELPLSHNEIDHKYQNYIDFQDESYDRLEFLGDRVIDLIVGDYIFHRYHEKEGFMTDLKTQLVRGTNLCILSKKLKLFRYILISRRSEDKCRKKDDILEDVFEAFIGAIYIDFGCEGEAFSVCKKFVWALMERYLNFSQLVRRQDNYKHQLLQYYHKYFKGADPEYTTISTYGPTNNRIFKAGVKNIDGYVITNGEGRKLVYAEQMAAKEALKYYEQEVYSDSEEPIKEIYSDSESESL